MRTWVAALAVITGLGGCRSGATHRAPTPITDSLLALADVAEESARVRGESLGIPSRQISEERIKALTSAARALLAERPKQHPLSVLSALVFEREGYQREVEEAALSHALLPRVLAARRGSCLGLGALYLVLAEQLGLPIRLAVAPGHVLVRYLGDARGAPRSAELLRRGEDMPLDWYRQRYGAPLRHSLYLRPLEPHEALALFRYNLANAHREQGDLPRARELYAEVVAVLPDFAEAQANLGLVYQRIGELVRADQAYRAAQRSYPGLPGLAQNLELLRRERRRGTRQRPTGMIVCPGGPSAVTTPTGSQAGTSGLR